MAAADEDTLVVPGRAYKDSFFSFAKRMLGAAPQAEDVVQRTFLRLHRKAASFRARHRASGWLYRLLTNECIDTWRKRRYERARLGVPPCECATCRRAERTDLRAALLAGPAQARCILLLCYGEGFSRREIAGLQGISVNPVKTQLQRAKRILRRYRNGDEQ